MADTSADYFAGLDIGGSTIKSILVNSKGERAGKLVEVSSHVTEGYEATFVQLEEALDSLTAGIGLTRKVIKGIGIDVPAPSSDGVIWGQANLSPNWVGQNIRDSFSKRTGMPAFMTNDCNAAALGEYAVRQKHLGGLLYVAPGTGFGAGLVLPGGKLYEGANGLALEAGHVSVPFREEDGSLPACSCGLDGCVEAWVSLMALRRRLTFELAKDEWADHPLNSGDLPIAKKAFQLRSYAEKNDKLAVRIFKQQAHILGYALADFVRLFDPGLVIIGGGLAETSFRDRYLEWVHEGFDDHARSWTVIKQSPVDPDKMTTVIEWALAGDAAGAIGMAFIAREMFSVTG